MTCDHATASTVHNATGEPVRLVCTCGREWRVLPIEWRINHAPTEQYDRRPR